MSLNLKDTSDSPFLLRFSILQKECYTNKYNDVIYFPSVFYEASVNYLLDASLITEGKSNEIILETKKKSRIYFALSLFTGYETALFTIPKNICANFLTMYSRYMYQPLEQLMSKPEYEGAIQEGGKGKFWKDAYNSLLSNCDLNSQLGDCSIFEINKKKPTKGKTTFDSVLVQMANLYYKEI